MISFRTFLFETSFVKKDFPDHKGIHSYTHETSIHGHRVKLVFDHSPSVEHGHYSGNFSIDSSITRQDSNKINPITKGKIAMHLLHKTHEFVEHIKPNSMSFMAADLNKTDERNKSDLYKKVAHHLVKRFGGKVSSDQYMSYINFRRNK